MGLEVQGNKDVLFVCDEKACGENCSKDWFGECKHTLKIEHAKNFDKLSDDLYMEKERPFVKTDSGIMLIPFNSKYDPCRYEKVVIFFDIAVICIVLVDIALMLWG